MKQSRPIEAGRRFEWSCSEIVQSLAEGNRLTMRKSDGEPQTFFNGEINLQRSGMICRDMTACVREAIHTWRAGPRYMSRKSMGRKVVPGNEEAQTSEIAEAIFGLLGQIPDSTLVPVGNPEEEARRLANAASTRASLTAGALALPPGPIGWLTLIPELIAVWRIQAQLVADVASLYGKTSTLTQEQMIYCLFRHAAAQAMRDIVVRVGGRVLVKRSSLRVLKRVLARVGVKVAQRTIGKGVARWLPAVGALGVGAYAYYDTAQVAKTAIEFFSQDILVESDVVGSHGSPA
ncbi:hypothetical protein LDO31_04055 [Luteimonas sp. XNQY3]|nr:hypothetical protein [Luteimonas sp. XNQY3]MCD9005421.1 hypothetical protein [Luteimonas sp. XNQY3]